MVKKRMELRKAYVRSEFQPLSHWATLGYDIDRIERTTRAEDKQMNPQLGMTFRVHVRGSTDETIEAKERAEVLKAIKKKKAPQSPNKRKRVADAHETSPKKLKMIADASQPGGGSSPSPKKMTPRKKIDQSPKTSTPSSTSPKDSSSESEGSTSESSSEASNKKKGSKKKEDARQKKKDARQKKKENARQKKKLAKDKKKEAQLKKLDKEKQKKMKEEERRLKAEARAAEQSANKIEKQRTTVASKAVAGLSSVRTSLDAALFTPAASLMANIPEFVVTNARTTLLEVEQMVRKAQARVKAKHAPYPPFEHTLEEITALVKKATECEKEVSSFTSVLTSVGVA